MSSIITQTPEFILDPEGEVTIILHNPDAPFAVWDLTPPSIHHGGTEVDWTPEPATKASRRQWRDHAMALARRIAEPSEATAHVFSELTLFENDTENGHEPEQPGEGVPRDSPGDNEQKPSDKEPPTPEPAPVRFRVSAKHLMLASPVFQRMLSKHRWTEANQLQERGSVVINASDFGAEALLVFLQIIHCKVTELPEKMGLDLMARLAVVADYYECRDLVAFYVHRIVRDNHCNTQPKRFSRALVLWIWVTYFFKIHDLFYTLTTTAVREAGGTITSLGLPMPKEILDNLNATRVKGIKKVIDALHATKEAFLTPPFNCSMQCDSVMLGALTVQMQVHGLLSPKPQEPFDGLRHRQLVEDVADFWCPEALDVKHSIHYGLSKKPECRFSPDFKKTSYHLGRIQPPTFDNYLRHTEWFISGFALLKYLPEFQDQMV